MKLLRFLPIAFLLPLLSCGGPSPRSKVAGVYRFQFNDFSAEGYQYLILDEDGKGCFFDDYIVPDSKEKVHAVLSELIWDVDTATNIITIKEGNFDVPEQMQRRDLSLHGDSIFSDAVFRYGRVDTVINNWRRPETENL